VQGRSDANPIPGRFADELNSPPMQRALVAQRKRDVNADA
jgi:hypothetical protein